MAHVPTLNLTSLALARELLPTLWLASDIALDAMLRYPRAHRMYAQAEDINQAVRASVLRAYEVES